LRQHCPGLHRAAKPFLLGKASQGFVASRSLKGHETGNAPAGSNPQDEDGAEEQNMERLFGRDVLAALLSFAFVTAIVFGMV
jgi:hypothetical protein